MNSGIYPCGVRPADIDEQCGLGEADCHVCGEQYCAECGGCLEPRAKCHGCECRAEYLEPDEYDFDADRVALARARRGFRND